MKFWAKVEFKGEENASELVLAFFREFNPESSITIQGKEAKVEIIFDNNAPMETIKAVHRCHVKEFYYGKVLGEYIQEENQLVQEGEPDAVTQFKGVEQEVVTQAEKAEQEVVTLLQGVEQETAIQNDEVTPEDEIPKQIEDEAVEEAKATKQTKKTRKKIGKSTNKKVDPTKVVSKEMGNVDPCLEEIAKKATSFEHFVKLVAQWLEMGKKQHIFENLVMVASELENVTWKNLEAELASRKNIIIKQYDKIYIGRQVSAKLDKYSITTSLLINAMKEYKNYHFEQQTSVENPVTDFVPEDVTLFKEEISAQVEEVTPKTRVKMDCMPEIIYFEEILGAVDKTQSIEERVKYVLNSMGLEKRSVQEQNAILEIANVAVTLEKPDWDTIYSKSSQPTEYLMNARMLFSEFIDEFLSGYNKNAMVKVLTFLKQLQEIVMTESEMESLPGSTN